MVKFIELNRNGALYLDAERYEAIRSYRVPGVAPSSYHAVDVKFLWHRRCLHGGGRMPGVKMRPTMDRLKLFMFVLSRSSRIVVTSPRCCNDFKGQRRINLL